MRVSLVVDFDPITADVAPGTIWHPYHVLSALCSVSCLGRVLEIEIQLSRLIRLGLRVHDRGLDRHSQAMLPGKRPVAVPVKYSGHLDRS